LTEESIQLSGHNCYFIPRESFDPGDMIYGEYAKSKYEKAYLIECYLTNVKEFEGEKDFFSKFGLEIKESSNLILARRTFMKIVPTDVRARPLEGDLIYVPVFRRMLEIKFIEEESEQFALGKRMPYTYNMRCELFRYTHEPITTGNEAIDNVMMENTYTLNLHMKNGSNSYYVSETVYQGDNLEFSTATAIVKEWDSANSELLVVNIVGEFLQNHTVIGSQSNTIYTIEEYNKKQDHTDYDMYDNFDLYDQANVSLVTTETNPLGTI
jgi:hypothetical protein